MERQIRFALAAIVVLIIFAACSSEDVDGGDKPLPQQGVAMSMDLIVPGTSAFSTYAITSEDENELKTVDLLVFKQEGGEEYFSYLTHGTDIDNKYGSVNKNFKVNLRLSENSEKYCLVVVANGRDAINDVAANFDTTKTKAEILQMLVFASDVKWNTTDSSNFTPLPMWGEAPNATAVTESTVGSNFGPFKLLRSVARIDVGLNFDANDDAQGLGTSFLIQDVKIYNANKKSLIAPFAANIDNSKVTLPSLVTPEPGTSTIAYSHTQPDYGFAREIYIGEADNKTKSDEREMTCLLIGGYYTPEGETPNNAVETWYRLDFFAPHPVSSVPQTRLDILRNHRYRFNITTISGPGYENESTAFNSKPINADFEVTVVDESGMNNTVTDGQYQLTVDRDSMTFYKDVPANAQQLKIYVDHPEGWTIDAGSSSWLHVSPASGATGTGTVSVTVDAYPEESDDNKTESRVTEFWIKSGKLKKKISVVQLNKTELIISIDPTQLTFRKQGNQPQTVTVTTYPSTANVFFDELRPTNSISWLSFPQSGSGNAGSYSFQPNVNNTGKLLTSKVTVYIVGEDGSIASQTLTIKQLTSDFLFDVTVNNPYPAAAGTYTFNVASDTDWRIASATDDPQGTLTGTLDDDDKSPSEDFAYSFSLTQNETWSQRKVTFTPASSDPGFSGQPFDIIQDNVKPTLDLDKYELYFGALDTPGVQNIAVTSNAKWSYTTSETWNAIISSANPLPGSVQGANKIITTQTDPLTITPKQWAAASGTPAAGTVNTTKATFKTTDHFPATATSKTLTITSVVPVLGSDYALSGSRVIPRKGITLKASLNTNAFWMTRISSQLTTPVQQASPWSAESTDIVFPANTLWPSIPTQTTPDYKEMTLSFYLGASAGNVNYLAKSITGITQPGYYIGQVSSTLAKMNNLQGYKEPSVQIAVSGAFPGSEVATRLVDNNGNALSSPPYPTVAAQEDGSTGTVNFTVPKNESWSDRNIALSYYNPGNETWLIAEDYVTQKGWNVTARMTSSPVTS